MINPHQITEAFEAALCEYTGAKYAVAVNSCTMAIFLAAKWIIMQQGHISKKFTLPCRTYIGVAQSILHAGGEINFSDFEWSGAYHMGFGLVDSARRFTSRMCKQSQFQCTSFHASKILGDSQGGAILHDNDAADKWFRRARFDGRTPLLYPKYDTPIIGWHCYMSPDVAARLLWKLNSLPKHNDDLPMDDYPDLSKFSIFNSRIQVESND